MSDISQERKGITTHESHFEDSTSFEFHILGPDFSTDFLNSLRDEFTVIIFVSS